MKLHGRALWLCQDPALLRAQLDGTQLPNDAQLELQYGVSTDAIISGAACTLGYTEDILGPHFLAHFHDTVGVGEVKAGGFDVLVAGEAYGSGSSREVAVVAHQGAGIRLLIGRSFQRIFQENMVYCGLPFTCDFTVLDRLRRGEDIDLQSLSSDLPPFFRAVQESGGLLAYGSALLAGNSRPVYDVDRSARAMTCIEKIIASHVWRGVAESAGKTGRVGVAAVAPGEQVLCRVGFRGMHEYTGGMVMALYEQEWGKAPIDRPHLAAAFEDHFVLLDADSVPLQVRNQRLLPARRLRDEMVAACAEHGIRVHGPGGELSAGVCHRIVVEEYGTPGSIIVLTDSHSPTAGVLNAFAFGVGSTAMAFALRTGLIPVTVPTTVRVWVTGETDGVLSPKDLILFLIGGDFFRNEEWRSSATDTCVIQFGGPGLNHWGVDELSVLTNMTVEGGMMTGVVEPCPPLRDFLAKYRPDLDLDDAFVHADEGADYVHQMEIDLGEVPLTVATPGDSRNRMALSEVGEVPIHNVVIASCTGGSLADLQAAADILQGRQKDPQVRLTVTPSSTAVSQAAERQGLLEIFRAAGAEVTAPGCGSCIGNGPGIPRAAETTASTTNRNFDRRMGAPGPVYLVSPAVAAAAALTGRLVDPRLLTGTS